MNSNPPNRNSSLLIMIGGFEMKWVPFFLFVGLVAILLNIYIESKLLLISIVSMLLASPLILGLIRGRGFSRQHSISGLIKFGGHSPVYELWGKKYSASAITLTTAAEAKTDRFGNELNYERLSRFSEALASMGVPAAYISFSCPDITISGTSCHSANRSLVLVWTSGNDDAELLSRTEMYFKQLESICGVVLPNVVTKRMSSEELSLLLSSPLPFALHKLMPITERLRSHEKPTAPVPSPPPVASIVPSSQFSSPEADSIDGDGPFLGWAYAGGKKVAPVSLRLMDIQRHVSIFGATGGGKSTTAISLVLRLSSMGMPVLILDWHGEHSKIVAEAGGKVFYPGSPEYGITLNPLSVSSAEDIGFQVEFVTDIFSQIFQFTPPQSYMFREALKGCYKSKVTPTLSDLINELGLIPIRSSWDHETRMALMRRLKLFTEGTCGSAVNGPDSMSREELFRGLVSIDLSYLKDVNSRSILSNLFMKIVYDFSIFRGENTALAHVLVLEEAQNILPPRRPEMPRSIGERILGEIRKYGEGVIVISQFPSAISQDAVKNTAVRIIHAIRSGDDLRVLGESTSLTEEQRIALSALSQGEAVVNLPHHSSNLFVKVIPDPLLEMLSSAPGAADHDQSPGGESGALIHPPPRV